MKKKNYKNIAIMLLGPLGDTINASGVFRQLKKVYPESRLSLISAFSGPIAAEGIPEISEIYTYEKKKGFQGLKSMLSFGREMFGKFDLMIVLDNSLRSAVLALLTFTPERVGRAGQGRKLLLTKSIPLLDEEKNDEIPVYEHYVRCLKPVNAYEENVKTSFHCSEDAKKSVDELFEKYNLQGKKILGFAPICHNLKKSMEFDDTARLIELIKTQTDYEVVFLGGADVTDSVEKVREICSESFVDLTGKTTFMETACVVNRCSKFLSCDTSVLHLAIALKTPVTAVFFTKIFKKWGPSDLEMNRLILNLDNKKIEPAAAFSKILEMKDKPV